MKQKLMHNLNLKVLSVLFSIIIWIIVVNIDDPVKSVQFNDVPITVINDLTLKDRNLVYEIVEGQETVDVSVSGRRSVIEDISKDNINVIADMKEIGDGNTLHLTVTSNKYSGDIDTMKPEFDTVELNIEESKRIQKPILVETVGEPAQDYIVGNYSISLNRVNIEGPKSVIDLVQSAKVQVDVEGATNSISASVPIILYDALGARVDTSRLSMNLENINVTQEILFTKTVSVICSPSGEPEEGYKFTGKVELSPSEVKLAGSKAVLDNISQVTIPASSVNISNLKSNFKTNANVFNYLPNGIESADDSFKGSIAIFVSIEPEIEKNYIVYLNKVSVEGLQKGMSYEIINGSESATENRLEISLFGLEEEFEGVTSSDIKVSIDLNEYIEDKGIETISPGTYTVPVILTLPDGLRVKDELKLRIKITQEED